MLNVLVQCEKMSKEMDFSEDLNDNRNRSYTEKSDDKITMPLRLPWKLQKLECCQMWSLKIIILVPKFAPNLLILQLAGLSFLN